MTNVAIVGSCNTYTFNYTLLILKYKINLLKVPYQAYYVKISERFWLQLATCKRVMHCVLWHALYLRKLSLTQMQKYWFLLVWSVSMQVIYKLMFRFILQGQQLEYTKIFYSFKKIIFMMIVCYYDGVFTVCSQKYNTFCWP